MSSRLLPIEWFTLVAATACVILFHQMGLRWLTPDSGSLIFAFTHYLSPLFPAIIFFVVMIVIKKSKRDYSMNQLMYLIRISLLMIAATFIHFNIKLWAPIINPLRFDHIYYRMDNSASSLIDLIFVVHQMIPASPMTLSRLYHSLFVGMFVVSFVFHGIKGRASSERLMTATILLLILGAFSYVAAPAFGPFIFDSDPIQGARSIQEQMMAFHSQFIESHGEYYDPAYFVAGLAAMPSLHAANVTMFCLCAERDLRWLLFLYLPIAFYIFVEAVALKWHYTIDLAIGILIGWLCYRLADWMVTYPSGNRSRSAHAPTQSREVTV